MDQKLYKQLKHLQVVVKPEIKAKLVELAESQNRSVSNYISILLEDHIKQCDVKNEKPKIVRRSIT